MTAKSSVDDPPLPVPLSVEERLRHIRECCRLLADLFNIQAEATFVACQVSLSTDAYNFLNSICRTSADELERLMREMPAPLANWHGARPAGDA
jgi:hypothetical protein